MSEEYEGEQAADDIVELDLERTLTWIGNAVTVQAGGEFRMPLLVPYPSVLAIQFEVDGGYDIEFSLTFKDDTEDESSSPSLLVEPVRVSDREGQLDIDTTGVCEIIWSNQHAWMTNKTLSYQLQLAPKLDTRWRKRLEAAASAATDFRMLAAVEMADKVDVDMRSIKERVASLQEGMMQSKERTAHAQAVHERYLGHVKRLEEEVAAAKAHADKAAQELAAAHYEEARAERKLVELQQIRHIDDGLTAALLETLDACSNPLAAIFEAYAGSLYAPEKSDDEEEEEEEVVSIDRAEMLHFLQDFEVVGRGESPVLLCGVFANTPQQLSFQEFKRCIARAALALDSLGRDDGSVAAPSDASDISPREKLLKLFVLLTIKVQSVKLPVLELRRRATVQQAIAELEELIIEQ